MILSVILTDIVPITLLTCRNHGNTSGIFIKCSAPVMLNPFLSKRSPLDQ